MTGDAERLSAPGAEGLSLQAVIEANHRLDELSTARVIGEAAEAVHKAQKGGQALGTLSPAAIVVRALGAVALELPANARVGYAAPERLRGSPGDRRSDVFSLGVLLWEALAHERLFDGASDDAVKAAVLSGEVRPPSSCNANVPAELDAICKKALARDPADRYQSAKVMAAEISAVLDDAGYPSSNEELARYVAEARLQAPAPGPTPAPAPPKIGTVSQEWTAIGRTTTLGVSPVRAATASPEEPVLLDQKIEPAPVLLEKRKDKPSEKLEPVRPAEARPAPPAEARPAPLPSITTKPAEPKGPTPADRSKPPTPSPSSLPAWAHARPAQTEPAAAPPTAASPPAPAAAAASATAAPPAAASAAAAPPTAAPAAAPAATAAVAPPPAAVAVPQQVPAIPAAPVLPASHAPVPLVLGPIPGGTVEPSSPSKLSVLPPGAQTAILGSLGAAAEPAPAPAPAAAAPVLLGSGSTDDAAALASVRWHDTPPPFVKPPISEAETIQTPSLAAEPAAAKPGAPVEHTASKAGALPAAAAIPDAEDDFSASRGPHPASVVALPARPRRESTSGGDMLGGWGWGTDAHTAIDDDYEDSSPRSRKRLLLAIGGGGAAVLLVVVIAFAAGGSKSQDERPAPTAQAAKAWDTTPAPPAPAPAPAQPEPAAAEPARPEPAAAEPARPEPAAAEPARPEPAAAEPPKPEPPRPEPPKPEPPRPEPARVAARPEPARPPPEPPRPAAKPDPKKPVAVAAHKPEKPKFDAATARPIDPYAADARKPDPNAAYRTGLQQFARGDSAGALATFKASLAANPGHAPTWRGIGLVYEKLGKKTQARTAFQKYLELAPMAGDAGLIRERMARLP